MEDRHVVFSHDGKLAEFQLEARCQRCQHGNHDCYIREKDERCLECANGNTECVFVRTVHVKATRGCFDWKTVASKESDACIPTELSGRGVLRFQDSLNDHSASIRHDARQEQMPVSGPSHSTHKFPFRLPSPLRPSPHWRPSDRPQLLDWLNRQDSPYVPNPLEHADYRHEKLSDDRDIILHEPGRQIAPLESHGTLPYRATSASGFGSVFQLESFSRQEHDDLPDLVDHVERQMNHVERQMHFHSADKYGLDMLARESFEECERRLRNDSDGRLEPWTSDIVYYRDRPSRDSRVQSREPEVPAQFVFDTNMKPTSSGRKRNLNISDRRHVSQIRRLGACIHCRKAKKKCTHVLGDIGLSPNDDSIESTTITDPTSGFVEVIFPLKGHKKALKRYNCVVPGCNAGFSASTDLDRHMRTVHRILPPGHTERTWECKGHGCADQNKTWPRLDNFRQHCIRMHPREAIDDLVQRSTVENQALESRLPEAESQDSLPSTGRGEQAPPLPRGYPYPLPST